MRTVAHTLNCRPRSDAYSHQRPHLVLKIAKKAFKNALEFENYDAVARIIPHIDLDEETTLVQCNCSVSSV